MNIASRKEVAQLAGVSEATVSRVLNGVGPIKEETSGCWKRRIGLGIPRVRLPEVLPAEEAVTWALSCPTCRRPHLLRLLFFRNIKRHWQ